MTGARVAGTRRASAPRASLPRPNAGLAALAGLALASAGAAAEPERPLRLTVNPSGYEGVETLEQKLARREREADYLFRSICRGCGRLPTGLAEQEAGPFEPQRSLGSRGR